MKQLKKPIKRLQRRARTVGTLNPVRTVDTVSRRFISGINQNGRLVSPYALCRHNPFLGGGGRGIPDRKNNQFFPTDLFAYNTISMNGNNNFLIQTMPTLPCSALFSYNNGNISTKIQIDGNSVTPSTLIGGPLVVSNLPGLYPLGIPAAYFTGSNGFGPGTNAPDPYNATCYRVVALGHRLIYTGPAYDCAGVITVTPNPVSFAPVGITSTVAVTGTGNNASLTVGNPITTGTATAPANTPALGLDCSINPAVYTRDTMTFRPEQGITFIPKHRLIDFKLCSVLDTANGVTNNTSFSNSSNAVLALANVIGGIQNYGGGLIFYDNDWSSALIIGSGLNTDASFRWETVYCLEITPSSTSAFAAVTHRGDEIARPQEIDMVNNQINNAPIARDLGSM